jgi:hypothetical protein
MILHLLMRIPFPAGLMLHWGQRGHQRWVSRDVSHRPCLSLFVVLCHWLIRAATRQRRPPTALWQLTRLSAGFASGAPDVCSRICLLCSSCWLCRERGTSASYTHTHTHTLTHTHTHPPHVHTRIRGLCGGVDATAELGPQYADELMPLLCCAGWFEDSWWFVAALVLWFAVGPHYRHVSLAGLC